MLTKLSFFPGFKGGLRLLFFLFSLLYLGLWCDSTIRMIEQLQLFRYTGDYFMQFAGSPGGILMYAGKFVTQFFYFPWIGAAVISMMLLGIHLLLTRLLSIPKSVWGITFIPSFVLLILHTGTGHLTAHTMGLLLSLFLAWVYTLCKNEHQPFIGLTIVVVSYVFAGGHVLVVLLLLFTLDLMNEGFGKKAILRFLWRFILLLGVTTLAYYFVFRTSSFYNIAWGSLPDFRIMKGDEKQKWLFASVYATLFLLAFFSLTKTRYSEDSPAITSLFNFGVIVLLASVTWRLSYSDKGLVRLLEMDEAVLEKNWETVLDISKDYRKPERLVTYYTNMALCKSQRLGDEMFSFDQRWKEKGLYIPFENNPLIALFGSEVYYQLGMVNYAYRWIYEGMVMHELSIRHLKRLWQVAWVNQEYKLAQKYSQTMEHTLFYKTWTAQNKKQESIDELRALRPEEDFLLGAEPHFGALLRFAFEKNRNNQYLFDYLMGWFMLSRDLQRFVKHLPYADVFYSKNNLPRHYQEALMIYAMQEKEKSLDVLNDFRLNDEYRQKLRDFNRDYSSVSSHEEARVQLKEKYGDSYWYYYLFQRD